MENDNLNDIQWTLLKCPVCSYITPDAILQCPHDGVIMRAVEEHPDFGVRWKELSERINKRLDHIDAFYLTRLEDQHDATKEQLTAWLRMQRNYEAGYYLPADRSFIKKT